MNNGSLAALLTSVDVTYEHADVGQLPSDQLTAPITRKYAVDPGIELDKHASLSSPGGRQQLPIYQLRENVTPLTVTVVGTVGNVAVAPAPLAAVLSHATVIPARYRDTVATANGAAHCACELC